MAKFERNPSGSFPEKTKNKLPDFPLLIYRYVDILVFNYYCFRKVKQFYTFIQLYYMHI